MSSVERSLQLCRNPVAKYARDFNVAAVHRDRKKDNRKGYRKHKGSYGGL